MADDITIWYNQAGRYRLLEQYEFDEKVRSLKACEPDSKEYIKILNELTLHNLRLVVQFVTKFCRSKAQTKINGPDLIDYLQVGTLGLRRAIQKYDHTRGYKFSTYALPWIRSFVCRHNLKVTSVFHITENAYRDIWQYKTYGYITNPKAKKRSKLELDELTEKIQAMINPVSLDADSSSSDDSDGTEPVKRLESHYKPYNSNVEFNMDIEDLVHSSDLTDLQINIIKACYIHELTANQIKELYGVSISEIKRQKQKALSKLKDVISQLE